MINSHRGSTDKDRIRANNKYHLTRYQRRAERTNLLALVVQVCKAARITEMEIAIGLEYSLPQVHVLGKRRIG